jgi:hypothetical protein
MTRYDVNTGCEQPSMPYEQQSFHPPHPPMPADMRPAKDDLLDRTWFAWLFWPGLVIGVTVIGGWLYRVL